MTDITEVMVRMEVEKALQANTKEVLKCMRKRTLVMEEFGAAMEDVRKMAKQNMDMAVEKMKVVCGSMRATMEGIHLRAREELERIDEEFHEAMREEVMSEPGFLNISFAHI